LKTQVFRPKAMLLFALMLPGIAHGAQANPTASAPEDCGT
jgi:hypothetical protein